MQESVESSQDRSKDRSNDSANGTARQPGEHREREMSSEKQHADYQIPPRPQRADGQSRRVGFEIEFSGLSLDAASKAVVDCFAGQVVEENEAAKKVRVDGLGTFGVEIDWTLLKDMASDSAGNDENDPLLEHVGSLATALVPVEVVAPPIALEDLHRLDALAVALREAGAVGTGESWVAAYGVHINPELPSLDASVVASYVRACCLLQWWLADAHAMDLMRKVTPYIDLYPRAYLRQVIAREHMTMDDIFNDYLEHNATRNRAIDLLPLLAEIDAERVRSVVDDPRVKARPTIHYRFPDCHIDNPEWSLRKPWNIWCVVEKLAANPEGLNELSRRFESARRVLLDVDRSQWVEDVDAWLKDHGMV